MTERLEVHAAGIAAEVRDSEYARLLQSPIDVERSPRVRELADESRAWYARHGTPLLLRRRVRVSRLAQRAVHIQAAGEPARILTSTRLAERCARRGACSLWVVAASAGRALDREVAVRWGAGRPDEAFFLDRLGAAVAERLLVHVRRGLDREHEAAGLHVLPPLSPGNDGWGLADQRVLAGWLGLSESAGELRVLDSGALSPAASVLAVMPVVSGPAAPEGVPCNECSHASCNFRRGARLQEVVT